VRGGAAGSVINLLQMPQLNHRCDIKSGVLAQECSELLQEFFRGRRASNEDRGSPFRAASPSSITVVNPSLAVAWLSQSRLKNPRPSTAKRRSFRHEIGCEKQ